jgi:two-component system sensor histidine kinase/response regulator
VESALGQGAAFNLSWPCTLASVGQQSATCPKELQGVRALVLEDHPSAAEVLASALVSMGLVVDRAADADAALALLQASAAPHALVFANLNMPGIDGLALTQRHKADAAIATASPAVVLLATKSDDVLRRAAGKSGACEVLLKPVTRAALADTLARVSVAAGALAVATQAPAANVVPHLADLRVLLAQGHEDQQTAIELLSATGADVEVVGDGQACVDRLLAAGASAFGLLLVDLQLPLMDGHQTAAAIRAQPQFDALPIIAITAHAQPDEHERCLDAGMNDYLAKPINAASLYPVLAKWGEALQVPRLPAAQASVGDVSEWTQRLTRAVPGLNVVSAMRRVLGNQPLYAQLLSRYVHEQAQADARLAMLLARGDQRQAQLLIRTLKGVSVDVGADDVAAQAGRLEDAMRAQADAEQLQRCAADLRCALTPVLQGLRDFFAEAAPAAPPPAPAELTDVRARAELARLCAMLASMDSEAKEQAERLEPWLRQWLTAHEMLTLLRDVRQYDLDEALALLHRAPGLARWHAIEDRHATVADRQAS